MSNSLVDDGDENNSAVENGDEKNPVKIEFELREDYTLRVRVSGSVQEVKQIIEEPVSKLIKDTSEIKAKIVKEREKKSYRKKFFFTAHIFVFGIASICVLGFVLHFANVYEFNTGPLFIMGTWIVGTIIYLYLVIIKDTFGLKEDIQKPPTNFD